MMRSLKRYVLGAGVAAFLLQAVVAQTGADVARVQGLLSAARAALGGEEKLKNVQALAATGKFRRVMMVQVRGGGDGAGAGARDAPPPQLSGELELAFALPDRFMKTHDLETPMGGTITEVSALDGAQAWSDIHNSGMGGGVIIRRPQPGGANAPAGQTPEQRMRAEFTRYLLALLLNAPADQAVEWTYAGEAEAEDGRADVLDCKGANGFNARLFLDKGSHRPLMMTYRSTEPVMRMMTRTVGPNDAPPARDGQAAPPDLPAPEMRESEIAVRFADYRADDGIMWPHQLTFARDGEVNEEWEIKAYKVNPQFKADKFKKKGN